MVDHPNREQFHLSRDLLEGMRDPSEAPRRPQGALSDLMKAFVYSVGTIVVVGWLAWFVVASLYRQGHCIQIFGHWLDVSGTTTPAVWVGNQPVKLFCQ